MEKKEKKVLLFIVEGPSDEAALGSVLQEYFSEEKVSFYVAHGDITSRPGVTAQTIVKELHKAVKELQNKYRYKDRDMLKIIHLADTDGAFVADSCVKERTTKGPVLYFPDHIEAGCVSCICHRNHKKAELLAKLSKVRKIGSIPYCIYYMSCNLEHVLYNEQREHLDTEKWRQSDAFAEAYEGRAGEFVSFISGQELAVKGSYQETWEFIQEQKHSLCRYSNVCCLFEPSQEGAFF